MKINDNCFGFAGMLVSAVLCGIGFSDITSVQAQTAPKHASPGEVDLRKPAAPASLIQLRGSKQTAAASLQSKLPGARIKINPLLNAPHYIDSAEGFLTGPSGKGNAVSAAALQAFSGDPHATVKAFLKDNAGLFGYGAEVLDSAIVKRDYVTAHNGLKTTVWQQQLDGIPVFEALFVANVTKAGELVNVSTHFVANPAAAADAGAPNRQALLANPSISAQQAVVNAANDLSSFSGQQLALEKVQPLATALGAEKSQAFKASPVLDGETRAQLVWLPMDGTTTRLAWQVILASHVLGESFLTVIDAQTGAVVLRHGLTRYLSDASYRVYTSDSPSPFSPGLPIPGNTQPPLVPRSLVTFPALNTNASPHGWIEDADNETRGNNVDAHTDLTGNNTPDLPRPQGVNRVFDFPLDLTTAPGTYSKASVVNLFYLCNFHHDKLYELGFTEAAGNFQVDNFARGGLGGDPVLAEAQDGGGFDNANFATPPDGNSGRMQMYLWNFTNPYRDGSLDAEVVFHEATHGVSQRLVGGGVGMFSMQSDGLGEGWSDFYALSLLSQSGDNVNGNYAMGGYVTYQMGRSAQNYYYGIRHYPYSTDMSKNPLTLKDIDPTQATGHPGIPMNPVFLPFTPDDVGEAHNSGEVWCAVLWELRANLIQKWGFEIGNQLTLQIVTDGMKLSVANPTFLEARDAILMADRVNNAGANTVELLRAFAKRGMSSGARVPANSTTTGVVEDYTMPGLNYQTNVISGGNGNGRIDFNECNEMSIVLVNSANVAAMGIQAILSSVTPGVFIAQPSSYYPNTPPGGTNSNMTPFKVSTTPEFECGTPINFTLLIQTDTSRITNQFQISSGVDGTPLQFDNVTPIFMPEVSDTTSTLSITNFVGPLVKVAVSLYIDHTYDSDLTLELIAPNGKVVILSYREGLNDNNFGISCDGIRTTFDDDALLSIQAGFPPYAGVYRPEQPLSALAGLSGADINGVWKLRVIDDVGIDSGTLHCWSLMLTPKVCSDGGGECPGVDLSVAMSANPTPVPAGSVLNVLNGYIQRGAQLRE